MTQPSMNLTESDGPQVLAQVRAARTKLRAELAKVIVGQSEIIDEIIYALLSRGHVLITGVPGLGKNALGQESGAHFLAQFQAHSIHAGSHACRCLRQ